MVRFKHYVPLMRRARVSSPRFLLYPACLERPCVAGTGSGRWTPYWAVSDGKRSLGHAIGNDFSSNGASKISLRDVLRDAAEML
jgi:hypothetical protein